MGPCKIISQRLQNSHEKHIRSYVNHMESNQIMKNHMAVSSLFKQHIYIYNRLIQPTFWIYLKILISIFLVFFACPAIFRPRNINLRVETFDLVPSILNFVNFWTISWPSQFPSFSGFLTFPNSLTIFAQFPTTPSSARAYIFIFLKLFLQKIKKGRGPLWYFFCYFEQLLTSASSFSDNFAPDWAGQTWMSISRRSF